jgi:hypothetical protein
MRSRIAKFGAVIALTATRSLSPRVRRVGFGETAVASNSYSTLVDNYTATSGAVSAQSVYQFASASAARSFWQGIRSVAVRCPGFGAVGGLGTERIVKASIRGTQAFQADFSAPLPPLGSYPQYAMQLSQCVGSRPRPNASPAANRGDAAGCARAPAQVQLQLGMVEPPLLAAAFRRRPEPTQPGCVS